MTTVTTTVDDAAAAVAGIVTTATTTTITNDPTITSILVDAVATVADGVTSTGKAFGRRRFTQQLGFRVCSGMVMMAAVIARVLLG